MADNPDNLNNQQTNQAKKSHDAPKSDAPKSDAPKSDTPKSNAPKSFRLFAIGIPKFKLPKPKLPKIRLGFPKVSFLLICLVTILISYVCIGYFLSVLLTMRSQKNLAIAGFVIFLLLPIITAFADYELMKWGYLISGILIIGGLIFLVRLKFYLIVLAIMVWVGLTTIAVVGDTLSKRKKLWMAIVVLTIDCGIGLGIGYQFWRLAATTLS